MKVGQFIHHPKFGEGVVAEQLISQGGRRVDVVQFDTKRVESTGIIVSRCPLKVVPPGEGWLEAWDRPRTTMILGE